MYPDVPQAVPDTVVPESIVRQTSLTSVCVFGQAEFVGNVEKKTVDMLMRVVVFVFLTEGHPIIAADHGDIPGEPQEFQGMPYRVMKPLDFDSENVYPVIVSLHGTGGKGANHDRQLKDGSRQLP